MTNKIDLDSIVASQMGLGQKEDTYTWLLTTVWLGKIV